MPEVAVQRPDVRGQTCFLQRLRLRAIKDPSPILGEEPVLGKKADSVESQPTLERNVHQQLRKGHVLVSFPGEVNVWILRSTTLQGRGWNDRSRDGPQVPMRMLKIR